MENIESICGLKPIGVEIPNIESNPNFIFESDLNFAAKTLYDVEGNIINVNSWIECAHYVNGGWSNILLTNFQGDKYLAIFLVCVTALTIFSDFYKRKIKNN